MIKNKFQWLGWVIAGLVMVFIISGCNSKESSPSTPEVSTEDKQLYTCGMHPNVIQEGPGNCPICSMKLTPLGGAPSGSNVQASDSGERKILYWRAPMDPTYISPKPGKSPMGMDLIPVYEGEEAFGATVKINPVVEQNIGVRTRKVVRRDLSQKIRTIGRIDYDESRVAHVHTKFTGWIETTYINTTGQYVKKGDILLDIYSPQLVTAQEEYINASINLRESRKSASPSTIANIESILASTRRRLEYFDVTASQIEELARTGKVRKTLAIESPFSGIVVEKHAIDGMEIKSGMRLYTIADLSHIWVHADIYEYEVPWVKVGQPAMMTLSYAPGKEYHGLVQYIYPYLEEKTRTVKVRLSFPNPNFDLKPGMYTNVDLETSPVVNVVAVPMEAVLFSGERNLVFVSLGEGRFAPRDVVVGLESGDGFYEIREGISKGEQVVVSGQFLLDSESKLQESIAKMLAARNGSEESETIPTSTEESDHQHNHDMESEYEPEHDHSMNHRDMEGVVMKASALPFVTVKGDSLHYYTCPMESHSFVKMKHPGKCPECGMTLVEKTEPFISGKPFYTCPMPNHSHVVQDTPGDCPVCGMELVEIHADQL